MKLPKPEAVLKLRMIERGCSLLGFDEEIIDVERIGPRMLPLVDCQSVEIVHGRECLLKQLAACDVYKILNVSCPL